MLKAAAYARFSSDNQREESIDAQLRAIREYCQKNEIQLVKIYTDEAKSATTDDRPGFLQMIKDSSLGLFNAVIVHKLDRFSRDRYDSAHYKRILMKNGVRLISVLEHLDDSPESIILESVLEGMAEYYSRNLAREVMKGMKETALQCKHTGGKPPLGYDVAKDKTYVINEHEAQAVRIIFEMYAAGKGYSEIIDRLNSEGYRTKTGRRFGKNSIHDILRNEKYTGTFVFKKGTKKEHKRTRPDVIKVPNAFPAIISRELWERVQVKMDKRKRSPGERARGKAKEVYLLTGLIYCGKCGSAFIGNRNVGKTEKKRYAYYKCGLKDRSKECKAKTIRKEVVEQIVIDDIKQNIFSPKAKASLRKKFENYLQARPKSIEKRITQIKREIAGIDKIINNLIAAVELGKGSAVLIERLELQEDRKKELQNELFNLEAKKETPIEIGLVDELLEKAEKEFEKADDPQRVRQIIQLFVDKVVVHDDKVEVIIKIKIPAGDNSDGDPNRNFWVTMGSPNPDCIVTQNEYQRPKRVTGL